ncbi:ATP-binding protein [Aquabacterium sp. A3]|uniref:ATP-binding protein n=1 Tax=Aquabacterium sp. A3 TaxID=3132829 RepID=UPI003119CC4B
MNTTPLRSLDDVLEAVGRMPSLAGWRWRAVAVWTLLLLASVLLQGWWLSEQWRLPVTVRVSPDGALTMHDAPQELSHLNGQALLGVSRQLEPNPALRLNAWALYPSERWITEPADRAQFKAQRTALAELTAPTGPHEQDVYVWIYPEQGAPERVLLSPMGWWGIGGLHAVISVLAVALACVGGLVWLSTPTPLSAAQAVLALSMAAGLSWASCGLVLGLATPPDWLMLDPVMRWGTELLSVAALGYAVLHYPTPLGGRVMTVLMGAGLLLVAAAGGVWSLQGGPWWLPQATMVGLILAMVALMRRAQRQQAHPVRRVLILFLSVSALAITLISVALAFGQARADLHLALARYGVVAWQAFAASLVLTMPFLARTRSVFQEFSWLAVSSTVAASLDLLFVAVFSLGLFTSMTLSLFLAFGVYLCLRRSLLHQLPAGHHLSREHLFERLYGAARQVERRPDSLTDAVRTLLREVFEPMELHWAALPAAPQEVVSLKGQGTVLLVNLPHADREGASGRSLVLRHAQHGQRLFTTRDVRLAQYIVRQLEQASRLDAALEQGRSEERLRIAQDLHDDIGARLLTLMYQAPNPDIEDYIRHTIQDLKTLTRGLAASSHALSDAASEWKRDLSHRIDAAGCQLSWHASWDEDVLLSMVQWSALTRILRELVSNALGHAQASHIQVQLQLNDNTMVLRVSDNGRGRAPDTWSHGLGLGGIRKRVKQLGGSVKWSENVPCGIVCEVHVHPFMAATVDTDSLPPIGSD